MAKYKGFEYAIHNETSYRNEVKTVKNEENLNMEIGTRLKSLRLEQDVKQNYLAKKCHCSVQLLSDIENGKRKLSTDIARKIATELHTRMEYVLCEDNYKTDTDFFIGTLDKKDNFISYLEELGIMLIGNDRDCIPDDKVDELVNSFCDIVINCIVERDKVGEKYTKIIEQFQNQKVKDALRVNALNTPNTDLLNNSYTIKIGNTIRTATRNEIYTFQDEVEDFILFKANRIGKENTPNT